MITPLKTLTNEHTLLYNYTKTYIFILLSFSFTFVSIFNRMYEFCCLWDKEGLKICSRFVCINTWEKQDLVFKRNWKFEYILGQWIMPPYFVIYIENLCGHNFNMCKIRWSLNYTKKNVWEHFMETCCTYVECWRRWDCS